MAVQGCDALSDCYDDTEEESCANEALVVEDSLCFNSCSDEPTGEHLKTETSTCSWRRLGRGRANAPTVEELAGALSVSSCTKNAGVRFPGIEARNYQKKSRLFDVGTPPQMPTAQLEMYRTPRAVEEDMCLAFSAVLPPGALGARARGFAGGLLPRQDSSRSDLSRSSHSRARKRSARACPTYTDPLSRMAYPPTARSTPRRRVEAERMVGVAGHLHVLASSLLRIHRKAALGQLSAPCQDSAACAKEMLDGSRFACSVSKFATDSSMSSCAFSAPAGARRGDRALLQPQPPRKVRTVLSRDRGRRWADLRKAYAIFEVLPEPRRPCAHPRKPHLDFDEEVDGELEEEDAFREALRSYIRGDTLEQGDADAPQTPPLHLDAPLQPDTDLEMEEAEEDAEEESIHAPLEKDLYDAEQTRPKALSVMFHAPVSPPSQLSPTHRKAFLVRRATVVGEVAAALNMDSSRVNRLSSRRVTEKAHLVEAERRCGWAESDSFSIGPSRTSFPNTDPSRRMSNLLADLQGCARFVPETPGLVQMNPIELIMTKNRTPLCAATPTSVDVARRPRVQSRAEAPDLGAPSNELLFRDECNSRVSRHFCLSSLSLSVCVLPSSFALLAGLVEKTMATPATVTVLPMEGVAEEQADAASVVHLADIVAAATAYIAVLVVIASDRAAVVAARPACL